MANFFVISWDFPLTLSFPTSARIFARIKRTLGEDVSFGHTSQTTKIVALGL